jgi:endonuclease YncB( thermonuclease family)
MFWISVATLFGLATAFALSAERDQRRRLGVTEQIPYFEEGESVEVVLVLNGDEIVVEKNQSRARVRMLGIHSFDPVVNEREITAFGDASVRFLEEWILNKRVQLHFDVPVKDVRGRYLAFVHLDDIDINRRMVEEGVAMVYTEFHTTREQAFLVAEGPPRRSRRGIWGGKKARARIVSLRRVWADKRRGSGKAPADPLLIEELP